MTFKSLPATKQSENIYYTVHISIIVIPDYRIVELEYELKLNFIFHFQRINMKQNLYSLSPSKHVRRTSQQDLITDFTVQSFKERMLSVNT